MAEKPLKVIDSYTGKQMEFPSLDAYKAYMDGKGTTAQKTAEPKRIAEKIIASNTDIKYKMESVAPTTLEYRESGDSPSTFSGKDFKIGAEGSGKTLDQAAKEFADKDAYSPTGIWEFDLGYAAGRARKNKIEAAGGKEAFKAAKQEKRSAKRMKRDQAFMSGVGKLQSAFGVGTYGKDKKQQRKDLKQKIAGIRTEVTSRSPIDYGNVTNKKEVKGLPTKGKYGI
jgi:hypothetical protein